MNISYGNSGKCYRPLKAQSIDVLGISEWKRVLKEFGYNQVGSLRSAHICASCTNENGEVVGIGGRDGHGEFRGFVSSNHFNFLIDYIDEIVRLKERLVDNIEDWKNSTPEQTGLGEMHNIILNRHITSLPSRLAELDKVINVRLEDGPCN